MNGVVESVSDDAIEDDRHGLVYSSIISIINRGSGSVGNAFELSPGMSVRAEIKIGRRAVIGYFLSPLISHIDESMRER